MKRELCNAFGSVFITTEYDTKNKWIYNNWMGYQTIESVMKGGEACLELLEKSHCHFLLNDNQQVLGPWDHANEWIARDWTPRALGLGLTHFAHVVGPDSLAANSAEMMQKNLQGVVNIRIFSNMEDAQKWLKEMQNQRQAETPPPATE